jgi:ABC-type nitrate/sulfonate/bicarbonate transport system substrate-binding protein
VKFLFGRGLLVSFVAAIVVMVCSPGARSAEKTVSRIRAGYASPSTDNVLLPIAQKRGYLQKQGIEVEIIALRGGVQMAQALLSDSLQFAQMAGSVVVRSVLSGGDLVMIAGFINRISYLMVSRP